MLNKTDWELVKLVKNEASDEAFLEICRRYQNLFYKICNRYAAALTACGVNVKDIFESKDAIILYCIRTYKRKYRTKLSSRIGNYARFLCLNSITERKFILPTTDNEIKDHIENVQAHHNYHSPEHLKESKDYIFNILGQLKDQRIKTIFEHRYMGPKKMIWNKIARKVNASPQTVMSLHKKGIELIRNKLKNEKFIYDNV